MPAFPRSETLHHNRGEVCNFSRSLVSLAIGGEVPDPTSFRLSFRARAETPSATSPRLCDTLPESNKSTPRDPEGDLPMTNTDWTTIERGTEVRVERVTGSFIFHSVNPNGDVTVFGGSKDPGGIRMFRTFTADRVRVYRPRVDYRKFQPSPAVPPTTRKGRR